MFLWEKVFNALNGYKLSLWMVFELCKFETNQAAFVMVLNFIDFFKILSQVYKLRDEVQIESFGLEKVQA